MSANTSSCWCSLLQITKVVPQARSYFMKLSFVHIFVGLCYRLQISICKMETVRGRQCGHVNPLRAWILSSGPLLITIQQVKLNKLIRSRYSLQPSAAREMTLKKKQELSLLTQRPSVRLSACVLLQEAVVGQREDQPVQAAPRQAQRRAGPAGQPAAVPPGRHLQAGQVVGAAPRRLLPPCQELLPR